MNETGVQPFAYISNSPGYGSERCRLLSLISKFSNGYRCLSTKSYVTFVMGGCLLGGITSAKHTREGYIALNKMI